MKNPEPRRKNLIDLTKNEKIYFTKDKKKSLQVTILKIFARFISERE